VTLVEPGTPLPIAIIVFINTIFGFVIITNESVFDPFPFFSSYHIFGMPILPGRVSAPTICPSTYFNYVFV